MTLIEIQSSQSNNHPSLMSSSQVWLTVHLKMTLTPCSTCESSSTSFHSAIRTSPPSESATTPGNQSHRPFTFLISFHFNLCLISCSFFCFSDRPVLSLDTIVPFESTKAYDMLDIIHAVCHINTHTRTCSHISSNFSHF